MSPRHANSQFRLPKQLRDYGKHRNVRVLTVYGGQSYNVQINGLRRGADVIVGTPGRMLDLINKKILDLSLVQYVVLDEADEMLSMGFIEDIESILSETSEYTANCIVFGNTALRNPTIGKPLYARSQNDYHHTQTTYCRQN